MQTFYKRFGVIAGFAVLLTLLIGNALVTRRRVFHSSQNWVLGFPHAPGAVRT